MANYDVIVIGSGHAGIEAASSCARLGCSTLMVTFKKSNIGRLSCNPAIGGVGKGQLVKEIDALGGEMAKAADSCGIQFRILNSSKGAAVQSSRAQIDMALYANFMQQLLYRQKGLEIKEGEVKKLIVENCSVKGVVLETGEEIAAKAVVICTGTFLDGLIHVGLNNHSGGRIDEPASIGLSGSLKENGFNLLRFKTGTCPRLNKNTIDFSKTQIHHGDDPIKPFSFSTSKILIKQVPCHITYTNPQTHKIILENLDKSPLYAGIIKATGVRYCPSIEDKVVKFSERLRHQVFLEPEGLDTERIYPNGLSTSLPEEVQLMILRSIEGLEDAKVIRFGYGIEHTVVEPTQLYPTLETKKVKNLFLAGQINGTTGYEEAAAQGLVAGINAARNIKNQEPFILDRSTGYIGVLIDDLTTKGTEEPYRMFTSRVEYRLILREDNADLRLRKLGYEVGLVGEQEYLFTEKKKKEIAQCAKLLKSSRIKPVAKVNAALVELGSAGINRPVSLDELLKRPEISLENIINLDYIKLDISDSAKQEVEIEVKYEGFIKRQLAEVERFRNLEKIRLPPDMDYSDINGLSREIKEKLKKFKPINLGQASRISGVTPAAISLLMVYLKKIAGKVI